MPQSWCAAHRLMSGLADLLEGCHHPKRFLLPPAFLARAASLVGAQQGPQTVLPPYRLWTSRPRSPCGPEAGPRAGLHSQGAPRPAVSGQSQARPGDTGLGQLYLRPWRGPTRWGRWQSGPRAWDLAATACPGGGPQGMCGAVVWRAAGRPWGRRRVGGSGPAWQCPRGPAGWSCRPALQGKGHGVSAGAGQLPSRPHAGQRRPRAHPPPRVLPGGGGSPPSKLQPWTNPVILRAGKSCPG